MHSFAEGFYISSFSNVSMREIDFKNCYAKDSSYYSNKIIGFTTIHLFDVLYFSDYRSKY